MNEQSKHFANSPVFRMVDRITQYGGKGWAYKCRDCDFETSVSSGGNEAMNRQFSEKDAHRKAVLAAAGVIPADRQFA